VNPITVGILRKKLALWKDEDDLSFVLQIEGEPLGFCQVRDLGKDGAPHVVIQLCRESDDRPQEDL
jgi:hypothetical protein